MYARIKADFFIYDINLPYTPTYTEYNYFLSRKFRNLLGKASCIRWSPTKGRITLDVVIEV